MKFSSILIISSLFLASSAEAFIPEASGVTKVGETVVIAGDEEGSALWLSQNKGIPVKTKVEGKWDDMEGLATLDDHRFFAITSLSLTKKGKRRPEREQLMVMSLGPAIKIEKSFSPREMILDFLESELGDEIDRKTLRKGTPDEGGLNVEGLGFATGRLYLGLRSPLTIKGEAIIIEMDLPEESLRPLKVHRVDLNGKGIRSLDTNGRGLLILAGPSTDVGNGFDLHSLDLRTKKISPLFVPGIEALIRPEGVILESPESYLFVQDFENGEEDDVVVRLPKA